MCKTAKQVVHRNADTLKTSYASAVRLMKPHRFTISNQYSVITEKKTNLTDHKVMLHIDFSEKWTMKILAAVQSAHSGSSLHQTTLHTEAPYFSDEQQSEITIMDRQQFGVIFYQC